MESSVQVCLLDIAFQVAEQNGWKTDQGSDDHLMVHLPTRHGNAYIHVYWHEMADMLTLRIPIPFPRPVPEYAVAELCVLLNLVNERCIAGSWYYISDEDDTRIVWREEVHTDQSLVTTEQMDHILRYCKIAFETFYPVIAAFIAEKPIMVAFDGELMFDRLGITPEEAMEYVNQSLLFGSA